MACWWYGANQTLDKNSTASFLKKKMKQIGEELQIDVILYAYLW